MSALKRSLEDSLAKKAKSGTKKKAAKGKRKAKATSSKASVPSLKSLSKSLLASFGTASAGPRAVSFAKDNPNVIVSITTAGVSDVVPCTLNLPVGIYPLDYRAQGVGTFNVTVTGAEVSPAIAGSAPDSGTVLIKVS